MDLLTAVHPSSVAVAAAPARGVGARADAFALSIGSKLTTSTLMLACVLTIVVGAASMLDSLKGMDKDLKTMSEQLVVSQQGLDVLNTTMNSLPPTAEHLHDIVDTVSATSREVKASNKTVGTMAAGTIELDTMLSDIAEQTSAMTASLGEASDGTAQLGSSVTELDARLDPLVATQHSMLGEVKSMQRGMGGMNASLAYVIRVLNFMSNPPTGEGFTLRVALPKETLPPIPGVKVEADPVQAFPRGAWPTYKGP